MLNKIKQINLALIFIVLSTMLNAQQTELPNLKFYQKFFQVSDLASTQVWDYSNNNKVIVANTSHTGDNQKFLFMPIFPGSNIFIIICKINVYAVDMRIVSGSGRAVTCSSDIHLGNNQLFQIVSVSNYYQIKEKYWDTYFCNRSGSNISFQADNNGDNQRWELIPDLSINNAFTSYFKCNNEPIPILPQATDINGTGAVQYGEAVEAGEIILPFPLIKNDYSKTTQLALSPYYKIKKKVRYERIDYRTTSDLEETWTASYKTGNSTTVNNSFKNYTTWQFTNAAKIYLGGENKLGTEIGQGFVETMGTETTSAVTTTDLEEHSSTYTVTKPAGGRKFVALYVKSYVYELYRMNGSFITSWILRPESSTYPSVVTYPSESSLSLKKGNNNNQIEANSIHISGPEISFSTQNNSMESLSSVVNTDEPEEMAYKIYPNPVSNEANITNPDQKELLVKIFDLSGGLKYEGIHFESTIKLDLSGYSSGTYIVKITDKDKVHSLRFVKTN